MLHNFWLVTSALCPNRDIICAKEPKADARTGSNQADWSFNWSGPGGPWQVSSSFYCGKKSTLFSIAFPLYYSS